MPFREKNIGNPCRFLSLCSSFPVDFQIACHSEKNTETPCWFLSLCSSFPVDFQIACHSEKNIGNPCWFLSLCSSFPIDFQKGCLCEKSAGKLQDASAFREKQLPHRAWVSGENTFPMGKFSYIVTRAIRFTEGAAQGNGKLWGDQLLDKRSGSRDAPVVSEAEQHHAIGL